MTEIKFSGADVDRCVSALMGNAYLGELDGDDLEEVVQIVLSALVASGWRREQDVHAVRICSIARSTGWPS
jgi:TorA maturation chaperone TorD